MKAAFILLATIFCSLVHGQDDALVYLSAIDKEFRLVQEANWQYVKAVSKGKATKAEKKRMELLKAVTEALNSISALTPYKNSTRLRDSAIAFLHVRRAMINEDYARLVNVAPIAENAYDAMEAFVTARSQAELRFAACARGMENEYRFFAAENNLNIAAGKNTLAANLAASSEALAYYNKVYALFFANYKQEASFLEALVKNDINGTQQNGNALVAIADSSLSQLQQMPAYKNDPDLNEACTNLLLFYRHEAADALADAALFYVEQDNMQKLEEAYLSKKAEEKKAEDAERYREAALAFQKRAHQFETAVAGLESRRRELLSNWHKAAEQHIRKYVP